VKVHLKKIGNCKFECLNEDGQKVIMDGPPSIGGNNEGVRPMEMVLMGLAGCSAVDVIHILNQGKIQLKDLIVDVIGDRVDGIPSVFNKIHLNFKAEGDFPVKKLERAVSLSMEKYCSVAKMLESSVEITFESSLNN